MLNISNNKAISEMDVNFSKRALNAVNKQKISAKSIKNLVNQAQDTYNNNSNVDFSEKNIGVTVLMNNNEIVSGKKFDWTRRWTTPPDLFAVMKAFDKFEDEENLQVNAVAYYGDTDVPNIASLGRISQKRGSKDTLVATIQNDEIQVRTILDYMPHLYISTKAKK